MMRNQRTPNSGPKQMSLFEVLERRTLRSATLHGSELDVAGTSKGDFISVFVDGKDHSKLDVRIGRTVKSFAAADVSNIRIDGLAGDDRVLINQANGPITVPTRIYGEGGNDSIVGGNERDRIYGGAGNDTISAGGGNDVVYGEDGADSLSGDSGRDLVDGGAGNDTETGGAGNDTLNGGAGDDSLSGDKGNDKVNGGDGNDSVAGDAGEDSVYGGSGNDHFSSSDARSEDKDKTSEDTTDDSLSGGSGSDH